MKIETGEILTVENALIAHGNDFFHRMKEAGRNDMEEKIFGETRKNKRENQMTKS